MNHQAFLDLCERAERARADIATVQQALDATRQETAALLAHARQLPSLGPCLDAASMKTATPAPTRSIDAETPAPDQHDTALELYSMICMLLEGAPMSIQLAIVKALTAKMMTIVATQMTEQRQQPLTISA